MCHTLKWNKRAMEKFKLIFVLGIVVVAFVLIPGLGSDLTASCKSVMAGLNESRDSFSEATDEGMFKSPIPGR